MAGSFRETYKYLVPGWLNDGSDGSRVLHSLSLIIDASVERFFQGLLSRFPSYASHDALRRLGQERGISRGLGESDASYKARLRAWRYPRGHRVRGNDFALLEQVRAIFLGRFGSSTIDANGTRLSLSAAGVESSELDSDWTWDSRPSSDWSRFWLTIEGPEIQGYLPLVNRALPTPQTIGVVGISSGEFATVRSLLYGGHPWRPAGTLPEWIVVVPEGHTVTPDATWVTWHKEIIYGGVTYAMPSRDPQASYIALRDDHDYYDGDADTFSHAVAYEYNSVSGSPFVAFAGDPDVYPLSIAPSAEDLPYYEGDYAKFDIIRMPDDGMGLP